jgi:CRP-like cAMP-binding protein
MAQLGSGQHFGEMSLIDNRPRSASVTALTNGRLIRITRDDFYEVMRQDSVMAVKLLWNFIQTLSALVRTRNNELNPVASQSRPDGFAHPYRREDHDA